MRRVIMIISKILQFKQAKQIKQESFLKLVLILIAILTLTVIFKISAADSKQTNNNANKNNSIKQKESAQKSELVDKLNAQIEEQDFLLSLIAKDIDEKASPSNSKSPKANNKILLNEILNNLLEIEEEATKKQVIKLINLNQIDDITEKITCFKKVLETC